jgi:actin-related protein 5
MVQGGEEDSDAEEDDQTQLQNIEERLLQFDPKFTEDETLEGRAHAKNALINAFVRGGQEGRFDPEDMRMNHQLHLNVERIRVPEAWFQPGMFGQDYAGIGEMAGWIMNGYDEEQRKKMMQVSPQCLVTLSLS